MANIGSNTLIWNSLLSETQYATELTVLGLRTLCQVPVPEDLFMTDEESVRYKLHVGLHAYTSGLERLGKLAFSCQTYLNTGSFPSVRSLSHGLEKISKKIGALDFSSSSNLFPEYLASPQNKHSTDLFILLDGFAAGSGRYEYLDSLSSENQGPDTYFQWKELSKLVSNSRRVDLLLSLSNSIEHLAYSRIHDSQHFLVSELLNNRTDPLMPKSTAVSEMLFEYARWFAASLSSASSEAFYGRKVGFIPYLSEVLDRHFLHNWDSYFEFHVAQFGDAETLMEGLRENSGEDPLRGLDDEDF